MLTRFNDCLLRTLAAVDIARLTSHSTGLRRPCTNINLYANMNLQTERISVYTTQFNLLTSTGNGAVIPPLCANGVNGPADTDDERCIL